MKEQVVNTKVLLNEEQKRIVETNENKIVVVAVPAAGKTAVLTERVRFLIEQGANPENVVVITFTNAAAEEMKKRIGEVGEKVFIGTIHAYANYLLLSNNIDTTDVLANENFNELFELVAENLDCIRLVDYLLVDEVQDCDADQFTFLLEYIKPKSFFFVGDIRQTIYEWRDSRPDILLSLMEEPGVTVYQLQYNYRNARNIVTFARNIIDKLGNKYRDNTIPMRKDFGRVTQISYNMQKIVDTVLFGSGDFRDWFILTRTNRQLEEIFQALSSVGIPCETFKQSDLDGNTLKEKLTHNTVKVLTIHAAKGLEAKNVIVVGAYLNPKDKESYRLAYVAATRAKDLLVWCAGPRKERSKIMNWE